MSAALALQKALRSRLTATAGVTALVPATGILDTSQRPAPNPSIIMGEAQVVDPETSVGRLHWRVYHTLHVWKKEPSLAGVTAICWQITQAIKAGRLALDGFHCADIRVAGTRAMRDPDGETSHGIVTVEALVEETP